MLFIGLDNEKMFRHRNTKRANINGGNGEEGISHISIFICFDICNYHRH